ncbi:MAG: LytTR family DNA-binding domain-containing protein [Gammaproteobacteria bacterium]
MIQGTQSSNDGAKSALLDRFGKVGWKHLSFFVGVPIILGTSATFENWWLLEAAGLANTLLFYGGHALLPWWLTCIVTAALMRLLAPWRPNQIIIMLLGVSLALLLSIPYGKWLDTMFLTQVANGAHEGAATVLEGRFARFWAYLLQPTILWVGINLIFDRLLDFPRYRYDVPNETETIDARSAANSPDTVDSASGSAPLIPRFLQHLDEPPDEKDVCAIKAEQHYIKLHTSTQDYMVLYRFSDAVAELGSESGLQVHRSYWVRKSAIEGVRTDGKKMSLRLKSGLEVPVSQPYQALARQTAEAVEGN